MSPIAVVSPTITARQAIGVDVRRRGPRQVVGRQAEDARNEGAEVVERQVVERHLGDRAADLLGGFEVARVAARERRATELELLRRYRAGIADRVQLAEGLAHGVDRRLGLHARVQAERPAAAAEVEAGSGAVGVALPLAQVGVDPADELAAEDQVQGYEGVVVRRRACDADMADAQL